MNIVIWISVAAVLLLIPLILFWNLSRRLDNQRELLHDLAQKYDRLVGDLSGLDRRVHRLPDQNALARSEQKLEGLAGASDRRHRDHEQHLERLAEQLDALGEKLDRLTIQSSGPNQAANPLVIDSPLVREVFALLEEGRDVTEIARLKGIQVGEIELIRGLKRLGREPKRGSS